MISSDVSPLLGVLEVTDLGLSSYVCPNQTTKGLYPVMQHHSEM